jgi:hypothetical protein
MRLSMRIALCLLVAMFCYVFQAKGNTVTIRGGSSYGQTPATTVPPTIDTLSDGSTLSASTVCPSNFTCSSDILFVFQFTNVASSSETVDFTNISGFDFAGMDPGGNPTYGILSCSDALTTCLSSDPGGYPSTIPSSSASQLAALTATANEDSSSDPNSISFTFAGLATGNFPAGANEGLTFYLVDTNPSSQGQAPPQPTSAAVLTPEPSSLSLLTLGAFAVAAALALRRKARSDRPTIASPDVKD